MYLRATFITRHRFNWLGKSSVTDEETHVLATFTIVICQPSAKRMRPLGLASSRLLLETHSKGHGTSKPLVIGFGHSVAALNLLWKIGVSSFEKPKGGQSLIVLLVYAKSTDLYVGLLFSKEKRISVDMYSQVLLLGCPDPSQSACLSLRCKGSRNKH
jgi:hypothetical protein